MDQTPLSSTTYVRVASEICCTLPFYKLAETYFLITVKTVVQPCSVQRLSLSLLKNQIIVQRMRQLSLSTTQDSNANAYARTHAHKHTLTANPLFLLFYFITLFLSFALAAVFAPRSPDVVIILDREISAICSMYICCFSLLLHCFYYY